MSSPFVLTTDQDDFNLTTETEFNAPETSLMTTGTRTTSQGATRTTSQGATRTTFHASLSGARPILLTTDQDNFNLTTEQ